MIALALVAAAMFATSCGSSGSAEAGDDDAGSPSTSSSTPTTTAVADDSSGGGADVDPCALLTGVDVAALVGEPVAEPKGSNDLMGASCRLDPVSDSNAGLRLVVTDQEPADNFENQREVLGVDAEVTGVGDQAFHTGPYLIVLEGDQMVMLQVVRDAATGPAVPDPEMEAAMATVLTNLGS